MSKQVGLHQCRRGGLVFCVLRESPVCNEEVLAEEGELGAVGALIYFFATGAYGNVTEQLFVLHLLPRSLVLGSAQVGAQHPHPAEGARPEVGHGSACLPVSGHSWESTEANQNKHQPDSFRKEIPWGINGRFR